MARPSKFDREFAHRQAGGSPVGHGTLCLLADHREAIIKRIEQLYFGRASVTWAELHELVTKLRED